MDPALQTGLFRMLLAMAFPPGRGETMPGFREEVLTEVFRRAAIPGDFPSVYLEFPLLGEPGCDMSVVFGGFQREMPFDEGSACGTDQMLNRLRSLPRGMCFPGLELDIGSDGSFRMARGLRFDSHTELIPVLLESCDAAWRLGELEKLMSRLPEGWRPYYIGLFTERNESPLRLGIALSVREAQTLRQSPARWADCFHRIGFDAFDEKMLKQLSRCLSPDTRTEIELDLHPDGRLGKSLGLCMVQNQMQACDQTRFLAGETAQLLRELESKGLVDERWQILPHSICARGLPLSQALGEKTFLAFSSSFHTVKLKYRNAALLPTKGYLQLMSFIL